MASHDHKQIMTNYLSELIHEGGGVVAKPCSDCNSVLYVAYFGTEGGAGEMREIGSGRETESD